MHNSPAIAFLLNLFRPEKMEAQLEYYTPEVLAKISAGQLEVRRVISKLFSPSYTSQATAAGSSADKAIKLIKLAKAKGLPESVAFDVCTMMAQLAESNYLFWAEVKDGEAKLGFTGEYEAYGYSRLYREKYQPNAQLIIDGIKALCGDKEGSDDYRSISAICLKIVNKISTDKQ